MGKIILLSDTHDRNNFLNDRIICKFKDFDHIIHAGDYISVGIVSQLESIKDFYGVAGNCDSWGVFNKLGRKKIIKVEGLSIGICHGDGYRFSALENSKRIFKKDNVDIVVFGHSHVPNITEEKGIVYMNPGSTSFPRRGNNKTFGVITIDNGLAEYSIVDL